MEPQFHRDHTGPGPVPAVRSKDRSQPSRSWSDRHAVKQHHLVEEMYDCPMALNRHVFLELRVEKAIEKG